MPFLTGAIPTASGVQQPGDRRVAHPATCLETPPRAHWQASLEFRCPTGGSPTGCPLPAVWLANGELPSGTDLRGVAREGNAKLEVALPSSLSHPSRARRTVMGKVVIGVDPHKRINAVCVVDARGRVVASEQFDNSAAGFRELKVFWRGWRQRSWAVEGAPMGSASTWRSGSLPRARLSSMSQPGVLRWRGSTPVGTAARPTTPTLSRSRWSGCAPRAWRKSARTR